MKSPKEHLVVWVYKVYNFEKECIQKYGSVDLRVTLAETRITNSLYNNYGGNCVFFFVFFSCLS